MKTKKYLQLLLALIVAASFACKAQSISCNSFCVTDIQMDSNTLHTMNVTVFNGGSFVSYPHVSVIANNSGDTIATGMFSGSFGQSGNTSETYSVSTNLDSMPANFACTVYFNYNFDAGVCALSYPCIPTSIRDHYF